MRHRPGGWDGRALPCSATDECATGRRTSEGRRNAATAAPPCVPTSREDGHRARGGAAARRRHARCTAAKVLSNDSARSAPILDRSRRLRAARAPSVRAPPADGTVHSGERESAAGPGASMGRLQPSRSRPSGRAGRGPSAARRRRLRFDHRCAADGPGLSTEPACTGRDDGARRDRGILTARRRHVWPCAGRCVSVRYDSPVTAAHSSVAEHGPRASLPAPGGENRPQM